MYAAAAHCFCALHAASAAEGAAPADATAAGGVTSPTSKAAVSSKTSSSPASGSTAAGAASSMDPAAFSTHAMKFLQDGLADISRVQARFKLDPVPPPAAVTAALHAAQSQLLVLKTLFDGSAVPAAAGQLSSSSLPDMLKAVGSDDAKLHVLLGLLLAGAGSSRQPLQQTVLPQSLQPVLEAAAELAAPALEAAGSMPGAASQPGETHGV